MKPKKMVTISSTLKPWGNSLGIALPKRILLEAGFSPQDDVEVVVRRKPNVLREIFGTLPPMKGSLDKALKEVDKALDSRYQ